MHHFKAPHDMFQYAARYSDYLADTEIPEPASLYSQTDWGSPATRGVDDTMRGSIGSSLSMRNRPRSLGLRLGIDPDLPDEVFRHRAYQEYLKRYLRCVKGVDDNVARLIDHLKATGEWDNTLIIYTSDQGMMLGEHDLIDKRWMFDESMRMPLILRDPRVGNSVPEVDAIINNTDFAPYMIEKAGGIVPDEMQGESFAKLAAGQPQPEWRIATYYRYWMHRTHHDVPAHFGIRTDRYKLIFYYGVHYATPDPQQNTPSIFDGETAPRWAVPTPPGWEFYDLERDPEEMNNRYADAGYRDVIAALKSELARQRAVLGDTDEAYPHIAEIVNRHWTD
jgi:arylsulfatase A-like enzyme